MLNSVYATNYLGETLPMPLSDPSVSGIIIDNIQGIGPGDATVNMSEISTNDGAMYSSARIGKRTITFDVIFFPEYSAESVRHLTYKYFPLKQPITLYFFTDERECMIDGYVESNDPKVFHDGDEYEGATISVVCPYPYFYSAGDAGVTVFYGIDPLFEFPFCNDSLDEKLLMFGEIKTSTDEVIPYYGDAEVGMTMHIIAVDTTGDITVYNITTGQYMVISSERIETLTGSPIGMGDEIIVNTVRGHKWVRLLREGVYHNVLNALDRGTDWLYLVRGDNVIAYECDAGASKLQFNVENRILYEGV